MRFLHIHGASIGEVSCAFRLLREIKGSQQANDLFGAITYTSRYARRWIERQERIAGFEHGYWRPGASAWIRRLCNVPQQRTGCIVFEKDRRPGILALHRHSQFRLNFEAKPPQSPQSRFFEQHVLDSLGKFDCFAVEHETFAEQIRTYVPDAAISILGTLKAPRPRTEPRYPSGKRRVAFVSANAHEIAQIAHIVGDLRTRGLSPQVVVAPRYTESGIGRRNVRRVDRATQKHFGDAAETSAATAWQAAADSRCGCSILKTIGEIPSLLEHADVAVVCGSFHSTGRGHNFLEGLAAGVPTLVGPHVRNWVDSVAAYRREGSLWQGDANVAAAEIGRVLRLAPQEFHSASARILASGLMTANSRVEGRLMNLLAAYW